MTPDGAFERALRAAARRAALLVAVDFDGTIAPLVADRDAAAVLPAAAAALARLARQPGTTVAVVTGRGRDDAERRLGPLAAVVAVVGSHGAEDGPAEDGAPAVPPSWPARLAAMAHGAAAGLAGVDVESKPFGVALHHRRAARSDAARAVHRLRRGLRALRAAPDAPAIAVLRGHRVVELTWSTADKGWALARLRRAAGADAVVFLGDDRTDERAFATLGLADVGVKVGAGATAARWRVDGPAAAAALLCWLADARAAAVARASDGHHAGPAGAGRPQRPAGAGRRA